jgi:hypothetical protein
VPDARCKRPGQRVSWGCLTMLGAALMLCLRLEMIALGSLALMSRSKGIRAAAQAQR